MDSAGSADYYSLAADSDVCAGIQGDVVSRRVRIADCCYTWRMKLFCLSSIFESHTGK